MISLATLKKLPASIWCAFAAPLGFATGWDIVVYQSSLRPMAAEVRFFSFSLHAGTLLLTLALVLFLLRERPIRVRIPSWPLLGLIILFLGMLAAFTGAADPILHGGSMLQWVFWLVCIWFVAISEKHRRALGWGLVVAAALTAFLAILQVLHQGSLGLGFLGETPLSLSMPGVSKISLGSTEFLRGYGLFPHPNIAFGWIALGLMAFFARFPRFHPVERPELTTLFLLLFLGLLATGSKSLLLLGLVTAGVLWFAAKKTHRPAWLAGGIVLALVGAGVLWQIRLTDTVSDRLFFLVEGWKIFLQAPQGVGLFHAAASLHTLGEQSPWMLQPLHTTYGLMLLEAGLIGGLGWLMTSLTFGAFALQTLRDHHNRWPYAVAIFYVLISGLVDHFWLTYPSTFFALALLFGAILAGHLARGTRRDYT